MQTEVEAALREREEWKWFVYIRHERVVQQLNQRLTDENLVLRKRVIVESENRLVRYLTEDGATNSNSSVRIYRPFGRVRELWHLNMGLGFIGKGFMLMDEEDYEEQQ